MNNREQALAMGATEEPMPLRDVLIADLVSTFKTDVEFNRGTDNPMYGLFVTDTIAQSQRLVSHLTTRGVRAVVVTLEAQNLMGALRAMSADEVDCIIMNRQVACAGGFRLPVRRVTIACTSMLSPSYAIQLLARAHHEATVRALVWLRPEPKFVKHSEPEQYVYSNLHVEFNASTTKEQQDALVNTLISLGYVNSITLGDVRYGNFVSAVRINKEDAEQVHRALNPSDNDED